MKTFTKNEKFTANGKTYKFSQDSKRNGGGTHVFAFDVDSRKVCQVAISDIDTPKTKVTYSQVKEALKAGFVSPLNSAKKKVVKVFDKVATVSKVNGFEIVKVVKRGTKRNFFRIEKDGEVVCKTMLVIRC